MMKISTFTNHYGAPSYVLITPINNGSVKTYVDEPKVLSENLQSHCLLSWTGVGCARQFHELFNALNIIGGILPSFLRLTLT